MKIRNGFVSNSSSSSFVLALKPEFGIESNLTDEDRQRLDEDGFVDNIHAATTKGYTILFKTWVSPNEDDDKGLVSSLVGAGHALLIKGQ